MPKVQIFLPQDLYEQVKARALPVSQLLQIALQAEMRRQDLLAETDRYLAELVAEVGAPTAAQRARAASAARRIVRRPTRKAG
jgi:post-segregation antitoxin (ccd killing protein)